MKDVVQLGIICQGNLEMSDIKSFICIAGDFNCTYCLENDYQIIPFFYLRIIRRSSFINIEM